MTKDEELSVIREVLDGRTDRFSLLVLTHQKGIYNLCLRMLGNEQDALDASQEVFFRAFRSLASFRGDSRFSVWLYRLASNECVDMLRKRPAVPVMSTTGEDDELLPIPDPGPSPQSELERKELQRAVRRAMDTLPPEFRQAVVLRDINGLTYDEIAAVTGLEPGTVKSRIFRARRKLAAALMRDRNFSGLAPSMRSKKNDSGKEGADA